MPATPRADGADATAQPVTVAGRLRAVGVNPAGLVVLAVGTALVVAAYTVLQWFRSGTGFFAGFGSHTTFVDLHDLLTTLQAQVKAQGVADHVHTSTSLPYFGWLGWVLLLVTVVGSAVAIGPLGARLAIVRVLGAVIALSAAAATVFALDLVGFDQRPGAPVGPSFGDYLAHTGIGAWAAVTGFVLAIIACLLPRPRALRV